MADLVQIARDYLAALERGDTNAALGYLAPDVVQEEFPNRLTPGGARRTFSDLREGAERGKQVLASQRYETLSALSEGERVVLEVQWTATLAIPLGTLPAGSQMRARFAVFLDFREGRIVHQRNYDCFDPW